jgi:hypothetical protein
MAGKLIYKALTVLVFLAAVTLYVLGVLMPDTPLKIFDLTNSLLILAGGLGVVSFLKAITSKVNMYLIFATILLTGGAIYAGLKYEVLPQNKEWLYIPIGAGLLLVFLFFRYLFNIRRWDAGDNEKLGYKNYHVRQAEKEKEDIQKDIESLQKEVREKEKQKAILMMEIEDKQKQKDNIRKK